MEINKNPGWQIRRGGSSVCFQVKQRPQRINQLNAFRVVRGVGVRPRRSRRDRF